MEEAPSQITQGVTDAGLSGDVILLSGFYLLSCVKRAQ